MIKLLTIIGARPQIIKASAISRAIKTKFSDQVTEKIIHTGQHYDERMSANFFAELDIPEPTYNLHIGSGAHGEQTAKMMIGIESILNTEKPDFLIIYGDTNSTLAGAIIASKMHVPVVHVEAGLRSFNKQMPEEINRILSDHVSTYLFAPTQTGINNLKREGFQTDTLPPYSPDKPGIFNVGDIMYDNSLWFSKLANSQAKILERLRLEPNAYILATVHRNNNTDDATRLNAIIRALLAITVKDSAKIVMPIHPRTAKQMDTLLEESLKTAIRENTDILFISPVSFLEMIELEQFARVIITDSGGVQKEAYFFNKPSVILRSETEWTELMDEGAAILCDADPGQILDAYDYSKTMANFKFLPIFGDGRASEYIIQKLIDSYQKNCSNELSPI